MNAVLGPFLGQIGDSCGRSRFQHVQTPLSSFRHSRQEVPHDRWNHAWMRRLRHYSDRKDHERCHRGSRDLVSPRGATLSRLEESALRLTSTTAVLIGH